MECSPVKAFVDFLYYFAIFSYRRDLSAVILVDPGATNRRCNIFGRAIFSARKFTSRAEEPLSSFSYQTSSMQVRSKSV